ncbi:MAG: rhodanese-like domain-containing protein [Alkalispirochaeta sp.]
MKRNFGFGLALLAVFSVTAAFGVDIEPKYEEYARSETLVSAERAHFLMQTEDNVVVVDVRKAEDYEAGHIPGAVSVWRPAYGASGDEYEYKGMRGQPTKIYELLGTLGIDGNSRILVYSGGTGYDAFRFTWLVTMYGHDREKVHIIDGFFPAWEAAGLPTTTDEPSITIVDYQPPGRVDESRLAHIADVDRALNDPNVIIVDTRTPQEWWGIAQYDGAFRKGHIPGAIHINYTENKENGRVKSVDELRALYEAAGVTPDKEIIAYCQSGVRSSTTTTVLADVLGYPNVRNYDGSWVEWSYHRDRPVTAYFLYIVSGVFFVGIVFIGAIHFKKVKQGKSSKLIKLDVLLLVIYALFVAWFFNLFSLISMDRINELQMWIEGFGLMGPVVFILLFIVACIFFLPGGPFGIIAGIIFGPIFGTIWASIGSTIGASLAFLLGRYAFRGFAENLVAKNPKLKKIDDGVERNGWRMLMITRFVPIFPFNVQNYVYGLTKIPFLTFAVLSWLFMLPGTIAYVFIAGAAVSGADMGTIMIYFAIGAIILVGLSFLPKILKKKGAAADVLE